MFCKHCGAKMEKGATRCPSCGKENGSGMGLKIALAATAGALVVAILALILIISMGGWPDGDKSGDTPTTGPVATVPADGDPNNETCKGTYTGTNEAASAQKDTVIATLGEHKLTNSELQVYYWLNAQQYVQYASYYGVDFSKPLDTQVQNKETGLTWQQYLLAGALEQWHNTMILLDAAAEAGYKLPAEYQAKLDGLQKEMEELAKEGKHASVDAMIQKDFGVNTGFADYKRYMEDYFVATLYEGEVIAGMEATDAEIETYFEDNKKTLESYFGVTKDSGVLVDVRHILYMPDGATSETIRTEKFPDEAWESAEKKAKAILETWKKGKKDEESFGELAKEHSMDGSASEGGLFEGVAEGDMVKAFNDWIFDESRKHGDTDIVKTEFGYHVMFFVGSEAEWIGTCRQGVQEEKFSKWMEEKMKEAPATKEYSKIVLAAFTLA